MVLVPGNHDEFARSYLGMNFGGVDVEDTVVHEMADGRRFLVIHGDQFDIVVSNARWLALLGDWAYEAALFINGWYNRGRRAFGPAVLVVLGLGEAQGEGRRLLHRQVRDYARRRGEAARLPGRRSAATSTTPRSARSKASLTSIAAISSSPARPWPSIWTDAVEIIRWQVPGGIAKPAPVQSERLASAQPAPAAA